MSFEAENNARKELDDIQPLAGYVGLPADSDLNQLDGEAVTQIKESLAGRCLVALSSLERAAQILGADHLAADPAFKTKTLLGKIYFIYESAKKLRDFGEDNQNADEALAYLEDAEIQIGISTSEAQIRLKQTFWQ